MENIKRIWAGVRGCLVAIGIMCWFAGASTSDYYVMELGQSEPGSVHRLFIVGTVLMIPMAIHIIKEKILDYFRD
jgi:hypothetical protein